MSLNKAEAPSPFDSNGAQWAWNATSLSLLQECPQKYKYAQVDGWRSRRPSPHLQFGGWYAAALEQFHKHRAQGLDYEDALRAVIRRALEVTWIKYICEKCEGNHTQVYASSAEGPHTRVCDRCAGTGVDPVNAGPWQSDHNLKTRETLIRTIVWYLEHFKDDPCQTIILADGTPAVELSFQMDFGDGIVLTGHLDRMVTYNGDPYVTDNKTTGSTLTPRYFDQWDPNTQMSLYTAASKVVYDTPVKGVIIDAAQIAVGFSAFGRGYTTRTAGQLSEFLADVSHWVGQARAFTASGHWPKNTASCGNYGGCQFRKICSRSPEVRDAFLKADFYQEIFNPLEIR